MSSAPPHRWEPLQVTRQGYANAVVVRMQEQGYFTFPELLAAFREAGRDYDKDQTFRWRSA